MREIQLRYGVIAGLYYDIRKIKIPNQLDLIDAWFPDLIIRTDPSDGTTKIPARYEDREFMIHAVQYRGHLYCGGSTRVSQIEGRLIGSAAGNREKERRSAELIQKHVADCFVKDMELTPRLKENTAGFMENLTGKEREHFERILFSLLYDLAQERSSLDGYSKRTEAFPMDDETFDGVVYNAAYQLNLGTHDGLSNAYLWLLTGSLLRNEAGRVLRLYDSSFIAVRRQFSETGTLMDKLDYLFYPENYYNTYSGDDLSSRFPGVEWYCDRCGAHLNEQDGFDDHLQEWKCRVCGCSNPLEMSEIYDNDEDRKNRIRPVDPEKFYDSVERRRRELEGK